MHTPAPEGIASIATIKPGVRSAREGRVNGNAFIETKRDPIDPGRTFSHPAPRRVGSAREGRVNGNAFIETKRDPIDPGRTLARPAPRLRPPPSSAR